MANKALKEARKAYNRSKSTKNRIDIETGKKIKKKKKQETKSHYGQTDQTNKKIGGTNAKKAHEKNKTDKNPVKAHYGQVESKTRNTTGSLASKVSNVYKSNVKNAQANKSNVASSHFGQVTQTKVDVSTANAKKKFGVGTYSTANAKNAKADSDKAQEKLNKKGEKTVQTLSNADLKAEQDKAEDRAKRETAWYTRQLMARGRMTQDEADEAVKKAGENARKKTKEDHSLTYSNATMSNEDFQREMNASTHANTKVKDVKEADKAKREAAFYAHNMVARGEMTEKEANKFIKEAGKGHYTTQSANILDKLGGEGTAEESGTRQAGQMNDSKFASGVMQGLSYGDNTRAIGKYNQQAAELVDTVKQSGAYNTGYMTGQGLQFMLAGTNKMTDALVKGVTKGGAMRSALNVGLRKGGADMMFEAPLNTLDAIKMSTDANGNFDASAFKKYMLLNSGLSGGMGGIIGGVGAKMTKAQAKSYLELSAKYQRGLATEDEIAKLSNIQKKFDNIRQGNDVAKTDIIDRADYDAKVHNEVFSKNGNANDAIDAMNGVSTHSEKMNYAATIKENADAQFEVLRAERQVLREQLTGASPEQITKIQKQLAENQQALDRIGGIANVAERELAISKKKNLRAVQDLADNVGKMEKTTGVSYKVMSDADMRKAITDDMAQAADSLERRLADGEFPASERAEIEAQIKELRKGATDDYFYKGFYHKNAEGKTEILINSDSPQAHQTVIGHETGHLIKSSNEEEFFKLGKDLENYAKKVGDWDAVYEQLKRSYPEADRKELREEITCELLGRYVYGKDDKFIKQLAGEQPSVLKQIVDYIKKLLSGTTDKEMAKELKSIIDKADELVKGIEKTGTVAKKAETTEAKASKAGRKAIHWDKNADLAVELREKGMSNTEIKELTGWYVPKDGEPRFEFSDANYKLNSNKVAEAKQIVSPDEFRKAQSDLIPALNNLEKVTKSYYGGDNGKLYYVDLCAKRGQTLDELRETLEYHHAKKESAGSYHVENPEINKELEDAYIKATKLSQTKDKFSRQTRDYPESVKLKDLIEHEDLFEYYPDAEDITVAFRNDLPDNTYGQFVRGSNRIEINLKNTDKEIEGTLLHEIQHWIQEYEGFAQGANLAFYERVSRNVNNKIYEIYNDLSRAGVTNVSSYPKNAAKQIEAKLGKETAKKYLDLVDVAEELGWEVRGNEISAKFGVSAKNYERTLGEEEARDTEVRRPFSQAELDESVPKYADKDDILLAEKFEDIHDNRFSKEAKPKKSLYNFSNEKPEQKISKKVEALQKENDAQIKTMTTSNNADEVVEALAKSDEVEAKIEGLGSTPRRGESPKAETPKEETPKEAKKTEAQKLSESKYASDEVKTALKDIEDAGVYKEDAEKVAKKFNELDGKIAGLQKRLNNAKNKDYPTEAEKTAHIKELEDELKTLRNQQAKAAGKIEQMGKMKAVDDSIDPQEQFHKLRGDTGKVNKELKNAENLKNEDNWIKDKWNSVRRLWEDSLIEVENVAKRVGGELREEILTAANRVRNSQNVANFWITQGRSSFDDKVSGKSLDEIFPKELVENEAKYKDFQEYLIMKHVPARHAKGTDIYPEVSPELADKIVKKLEKEYGEELTKWADDVYGYLKDLQQYRVDSGMLSKEAADKFAKDYPFYVPTNRANDDEAIDFFTGGLSNQIRTAKGGSNDVLDMYAQLYTATNKTIHAAEENQMLNLYFRAKGVTPEQLKGAELPDLEHAVIEAKVNKKTKKASVSFFVDGKPVEFPCSHQLALGLRELDGLEFERLMNAAKVSTLYGKPFKALITDWNIVFGVRNGMRDMQQAVVNSKDTRYFGSSFGAAAHAVAHDDSPYRKLYASMGGERAQLVSYDAVAKNLGIEKQGKVDAIHEKVQDWVDASVNVKGKEIHTNPVHLIEGVNGAIEMMPRMCEFIGTLRKQADKALKQQGSSLKKLRKEIIAEVDAMEKAGKIGQSEKSAKVEDMLAQKVIGLTGKDTIDSAMRNANDITLNFGRSGVLGKALNMGFVPYLNPSIQGLSKLVRLFTEAGGEGGWKALASLGMKLGTFTITPAVLNEVLLKDNEDYQNLNTRDKDNNFFIPLDKFGETWEGKFFKFPKPRENAVLAEPVEYGLRYFLDKSEYAFFDWDKLTTEDVPLWEKIPLTNEGKQSLRTALDNIGVINPATSNMFSPLWQTFNNKTWYGGSIESAYETSVNDETGKPNVPVNERYDVSTTGLAIALGQTKGAKALNLSPKKIDNILDSYTGMVYDLYLSQTTEEAKTRGNYLFRTVASQFVKDSVFSNKLSTKAWEKMDGMTKKEQDAYKSKYMYDTFKYDDAMDVITADKNMTVQEKMEAKRALMIKKNKLNRAAINGEENKSNPLKDISKYLGANKTLNNFLPKSGDEDYDNWTDYYKNYKKTKGFKNLTPAQKEKQAQKFLDVYTLGVKGQSKISGDFHDSPSWGMTGVAAAQRYKQGKLSEKDAKTIMESCGVYESQTESYFKYADHGGNVSRYAVTKKNNNKAEALAEELGVTTKGDGSIWKNKYSKEKGIKGGVLSMSLATGKTDFKDRAYYISNSGDANMLIKMNAARGYSEKYGHTTKQLIKLGKKADTDGNTYLSNEEIESACMTIKKGKATSEERAMAWVLLGGNPNKNPFGAIGNYAHDGDTGITADEDGKSGGGGRRRGRRGRGGGGGGSSKGTMPKTDTGAIKGKVTDVFATSNGSKDSNLNDAYRKKVGKLRGQLNKR